MRILFLTQVLPYPLDAGPKVRAYYTLRALAQRHRVDLLSFSRPNDTPAAVEHLRSICESVETIPLQRSRVRDGWHFARSALSRLPFLIARDWTPAMAGAVRGRLDATVAGEGGESRYQAVHADQLWMAPYALLGSASAGRPLLVLDQHNAVFQIPRRLAQSESNPLKRALLRREAYKLGRFEGEICRQFDRLVWVTAEDRDALRLEAGPGALGSNSPPREAIIPICVDPEGQPALDRNANPRRVTFLGGLHWPPNAEGIRWFAREIWPQVRAQAPEAVLTIVGRDPPANLRGPGPAAAGIETTGYVADPRPLLAETAVFIVPLQAGGGMRVKILDAWCWGLPVVTTTIGAEGIAVRPGENALLADASVTFAQAVVDVLNKPALASGLGRAGRATVETHYAWSRTYTAWHDVYDRPTCDAQR